MVATAEYYVETMPLDVEALTCLVVSGATREDLAQTLSIVLDDQVELWVSDGVDGAAATAWSLVTVLGGVLGIEQSGYGDPSRDALAALSSGGRSAAVARGNVQAHERFGCARDGRIVYDADEFMFDEEPDDCPPELRDIFDQAWTDLSEEEDEQTEPEYAGIFYALAMAERWTGLELTRDDLERAAAGPFFRAPTLVYSY